MTLHPELARVTQRILTRSQSTRQAYLARMRRAAGEGPQRRALSCGNLAHAFAAGHKNDKLALRGFRKPNLAIVSAYNDMLSAHQPLGRFPELIKTAARQAGAVAQFAGGVPAMCDGVTQGRPGMELSLFSRDVIAMATAVSLSHNMFDAVLCLGVCDKIVPGLLIGALCFGHLPVVFIPAGPMPSGLPNKKKAEVRQLFAAGKIGREELLDTEAKSYHAPGTCTFYGTANSNQLLMEFMGLQLPGASFVNPNTPLRDALTAAATARAAAITAQGENETPLVDILDEKAIVNGLVGLLASGGSTNHALHLVAIARAAGIIIDWDDFSALSGVVPLLCRIYPNGSADVNHFHAAGGIACLVGQLLNAGLLHRDVKTVAGPGLDLYTREPFLEDESVAWRPGPSVSADKSVLTGCHQPFSPNGGLILLQGNLGRAIMKIAAVKPAHQVVRAPALVFDSQAAFLQAFEEGRLERDLVAVIRFQGPRANGMPELHKLSPSLGVLQDKGFRVALVTDGRMSGASGKVPAAIHVTPESVGGGPLAKLRDGDMVLVDGVKGFLQAEVPEKEWQQRQPDQADLSDNGYGMGRELFAPFRSAVSPAEEGASVFSFLNLSGEAT